MRNIFRWSLLFAITFLSCFIPPASAAEPFRLDGSTQFIWGDDMLDENQTIIAQYLRLNYRPEGKNYYITGYGRLWDDFSGGAIRDDDPSGRIYYLYMDYSRAEDLTFRLGRQFVYSTAGSAVMDGLRVDLRDLGPIGITLSGGTDVTYSLDSEESSLGTYFTSIELFLEKVQSTQLGVSYVRKFDDGERASEKFGLNARYFYKWLSPYTELRYDWLSESYDEATVGIDFFPMDFLMIKTEFYHSYPTFDATSIYSVFAVDKYQEYHIRAEYSLENTPLVLSAAYVRQLYEESDAADVYMAGASYHPNDKLLINATVDYRTGFGGELWGFDINGNYTLSKELLISAGAQYDTYSRPDYSDDDYAQRYWAGGQWLISEKASLDARLEENINQNFDHNLLGRVSLNWQL